MFIICFVIFNDDDFEKNFFIMLKIKFVFKLLFFRLKNCLGVWLEVLFLVFLR